MKAVNQAQHTKPRIVITCNSVERTRRYIHAIEEAGGEEVTVTGAFSSHPIQSEKWLADLRNIYEEMDGLLLSGGGDIDPALYNEEPLLNEQGVSVLYDVFADRDAMEIQLCRWALEDDVPVLAICRGHQLLNVVMGGSLYQDIRIQKSPTHPRATDYEDPWTTRAHIVTLAEDSRLAHILGTNEIPTNSLHHQAVKEVGHGLVQVGLADDFINEVNEAPDKRWCVSVQFHPEGMLEVEPRFRKLFSSFVESARQYNKEQMRRDNVVVSASQ